MAVHLVWCLAYDGLTGVLLGVRAQRLAASQSACSDLEVTVSRLEQQLAAEQRARALDQQQRAEWARAAAADAQRREQQLRDADAAAADSQR